MSVPMMSPYRAGLVFSAVRLLTSSFSFVYLLQVGLTVAEVSTARFVQLIALVVLEVPSGVLAARIGPRRTLLAVTLTSAIWLGLMSAVTDLPMLVAAELFNAVSLSLFGGAFEVLLRDTHRAENPIANFAKVQALWIAGASVLGALFATLVSREAAWVLAGVLQAFLLAVLWGDSHRARRLSGNQADPWGVPEAQIRGGSRTGAYVNAARTIRRLTAAQLIAFTAPTLVFDVVLQFWQPIATLAGVPAGSNLALSIISLAVLVSMSAGGAAGEMTRQRWLIPTVAAMVPILAAGVLLNPEYLRVGATIMAVLLLIVSSTALRSRAAFQLTLAVRGDTEVAAFSVVSAVARVMSGLLIVVSGAFLTSVAGVLAVLVILTTLIGIGFLTESRDARLPKHPESPNDVIWRTNEN